MPKFQAAYLALQKAKSVDEVKRVRDQAEAIRLYVRQQNMGLEMQNNAAEIKLRAERRAGEMLEESLAHKGGRPKKTVPSCHCFEAERPWCLKEAILPLAIHRRLTREGLRGLHPPTPELTPGATRPHQYHFGKSAKPFQRIPAHRLFQSPGYCRSR